MHSAETAGLITIRTTPDSPGLESLRNYQLWYHETPQLSLSVLNLLSGLFETQQNLNVLANAQTDSSLAILYRAWLRHFSTAEENIELFMANKVAAAELRQLFGVARVRGAKPVELLLMRDAEKSQAQVNEAAKSLQLFLEVLVADFLMKNQDQLQTAVDEVDENIAETEAELVDIQSTDESLVGIETPGIQSSLAKAHHLSELEQERAAQRLDLNNWLQKRKALLALLAMIGATEQGVMAIQNLAQPQTEWQALEDLNPSRAIPLAA